ncbi:MAG: DUF5060 domain-containing protein [bacterium]|nr:DUF5060 domain-containing protein [bacterium]
MKTYRWAFVVLLLAGLAGCAAPAGTVSGDLMLWHRVTVTFDGPEMGEDGEPNPFLQCRLDVTFTHTASGTEDVVPGFFAADGDAANTSATSGNKWRVHFAPDREGEWTYAASFRWGRNISIDRKALGEPAAFDGATGTFTVGPSDKAGRDFRAKGRLEYTGEHYLRHAGNGEYFLKGGADSPENFLAYYEFDNTFDTAARFNEGTNEKGKFIHEYAPHAGDYAEGDPTWAGGKGKNIIGALTYLASEGMNSVYFLTYNIDGGDGKDVWMWSTPEVRDRFDVSKLAQWEIVFTHMDTRGLMLHVITQETENDRALGGGPGLNTERKLYYRELVARFAHHPAIVWNQGEENNTPDTDRSEIAAFIRDLDPYDHPITVHTHNNKARQDYAGILGDANFEATSIQGKMENYNADAIHFRAESAKAGRKWVVFGDEQPSAQVGVMPDADDPEHDIPRTQALWGNLMGGGGGVEWYFGYKHPHMDLNCEDWRSRDAMWDQTRHALEFFRQILPFWEMEPANDLAVGGRGALVFAKAGELYAVYLPSGGTTRLQLGEGMYSIQWYNPRSGGDLRSGSRMAVAGPGAQALGNPPSERTKDWAVLVKKQ